VAVLPRVPRSGRKMKRSRTEAAETSSVIRAAADRFQREEIDAGRGPMKWNAWPSNSRPVQSIVGSGTLDPSDTESVFPKLRRYGENQLRCLSKPLLAAEAEENGPAWGLKKCLAKWRGSRISDRKGRSFIRLFGPRHGNALVVRKLALDSASTFMRSGAMTHPYREAQVSPYSVFSKNDRSPQRPLALRPPKPKPLEST